MRFAGKSLGLLCLVAGLAVFASASVPVAPEIDGASATSALTLLAGAVLLLRSRRK